MTFNQSAAANRRPAGQSDGSGNLVAIIAGDRAFPAAVAELVGVEFKSYAHQIPRSFLRAARNSKASYWHARRHGRHGELFSFGRRNASDAQETVPDCMGHYWQGLGSR